MIGKLGPYELLEKLGEGGMGAVYKARHPKLKKIVALKVLPPSAMRDQDAIARFEREMEAVGKLEHPNIVRALDAGEHEGISYLVMEYVEGQDLHRLVKERGPFSVVEACGLIRQAAIALAHAHQIGLVHRDIKPSNLLLTKSGQVKLLDLGLARLASDAAAENLTSTGVTVGTPDFMAPEQWVDTHEVDGRCDLYALGCTLFVLLTGRPPYGDKKHKSVVSKMTAHVHEAIPSLREVCPDIPADLDQLFQRLLAKQVDERLGSAAELAHWLEPHCGASDPAATDGRLSALPFIALATPKSQLPSKQRSARNYRRYAATAGLAFAGIAALLIALWVNRQVIEPVAKAPPDPVKPVVAANSSGDGWPGWPKDAPPPAIAPFDADQAKRHQKEWARYLQVPGEITNSQGMKFLLIPAGATTEPFYLAATETTQEEYESVVKANPSWFAKTGDGAEVVKTLDTSRFPVENLTLREAQSFCEQLSQSADEKKEDRLYRLPTSDEWTLACQAGSVGLFHFGDSISSKQANFDGNVPVGAERGTFLGRPATVGSYPPNAFELFDMHGNVSEFCTDPLVLRGGSWDHKGLGVRTAVHYSIPANSHVQYDGFRVALSINSPRARREATEENVQTDP